MSGITKKERENLYKLAKTKVGSPPRPFQIETPELDVLLNSVIEDYSLLLNNWLSEQQWHNLQNISLDKANIFAALTTKSMDFVNSFTLAYSKQIGFGNNAPSEWELKRDFIVISADTQVYSIPANREVNEVLWHTPAQIDSGMVDPFAATNWGAGTFGWSYLGKPAQYVQPTYSLLLAAADRETKKRIIQSDLTYRVTAGANGTKNLYLYPVPGSKLEIYGNFGKHFEGSKVWYFYYDTNSLGRKKCLEKNSDVIKLPSDIPLDTIEWSKMNDISKIRIRKLFIAEVKITLGNIRGFYSGQIKVPNTELEMDYRMLLEAGEKEKEETINEIMESLGKMSYKQMLADQADMAENLNRIKKLQPLKTPFKWR